MTTNLGKAPILSSHCGSDGSYRDSIRRLSNSTKRYDNEYWLWSTRRSTGDGGCSYTQVLGLTPRGTSNCGYIDNRNHTNCGAVGYINLSGNRTQDWISATGMHETGHALNGRHDDDAYGNTGQSWNSHRCTFLGIWAIGPTGPSLMSYASGTETFCFARTDSDGSPKKNVTLIAEFLHTVLGP
ncbi:MAG: M12 family metallo-peptidase [Deinococcales bacterium]